MDIFINYICVKYLLTLACAGKQFILTDNPEGIEIYFNDEHPKKTYFLIEVTEEGIAICVNEEQP